jgi:hypothetical protein
MMTGAELKKKAIKLYGEEDWQTSLAADLKCHPVSVYRYSKQAKVPFLIEARVDALMERATP